MTTKNEKQIRQQYSYLMEEKVKKVLQRENKTMTFIAAGGKIGDANSYNTKAPEVWNLLIHQIDYLNY